MKNLIKKLTIGVLVAAIVLTGIVIPDTTVTVEAATTTGTFKNGGTITMKPGDKKKLLVTDTNKSDITSKYKWSSSDKSIIKVETDFYDSKKDLTECVVIIATGAGTATVTGRSKTKQGDIKMTIKVSLPKPTKKQKKCKHKYKTTKSATCERIGIKTCKKCKYQKEIKKVSHKYVNTTTFAIEYDEYADYIACSACDCPKREGDGVPICNGTGNCKTMCTYKVNIKDYPTLDDAFDAYYSDGKHCKFSINRQGHDTYEMQFDVGIGEPHQTKKETKTCKWCGKEK